MSGLMRARPAALISRAAPPAGLGLNLLDDVHPHARRVDDPEAQLAPRLLGEREVGLEARGDHRSCSVEASATCRVRNVPSPAKVPGSGGVDGCEGSMNATTGASSWPMTAIQPASNTTSKPNHFR